MRWSELGGIRLSGSAESVLAWFVCCSALILC